MYIQQDAMLHNSFYVETALHVSGGTTHHQEHKQLYLQHLVFATLLLLPAAIASGSTPPALWGIFSVQCDSITVYLQYDYSILI